MNYKSLLLSLIVDIVFLLIITVPPVMVEDDLPPVQGPVAPPQREGSFFPFYFGCVFVYGLPNFF